MGLVPLARQGRFFVSNGVGPVCQPRRLFVNCWFWGNFGAWRGTQYACLHALLDKWGWLEMRKTRGWEVGFLNKWGWLDIRKIEAGRWDVDLLHCTDSPVLTKHMLDPRADEGLLHYYHGCDDVLGMI